MHSVRIVKQMRDPRRKGKTNEIDEMVAHNPGAETLRHKPMPSLHSLLHEERQTLRIMQEDADEYRERHHDKIFEKVAEMHNKEK